MDELRQTIVTALWDAQKAYDAALEFNKSIGEKEYALGRLQALQWVIKQFSPPPPAPPPAQRDDASA